MATSKSFFGLRRGSTKSLTFQVFRGQQVTKDRVAHVSNPQSNQQMAQRLIIPMVASARATLKTLVDHSFEGTPYGEQSLKEFSSSNLRKDALSKILAYVPKGGMDCGLANYIISRGSLNPITSSVTDFSNDDNTAKEPIKTSIVGVSAGQATTAPSDNTQLLAWYIPLLIQANAGILQAGDQLTFLLCYLGQQYDYPINKDGDEQGAYFHRFLISRFVLDADSAISKGWKITATRDASTEALNGISLSDGYVTIAQTFGDNPVLTYDVDEAFAVAKDKVVGATVILSRKNGNDWYRSSQRLTLWGNHVEPDFEDALFSYTKSSKTSSKYLNSGVDGVDITGGKTATPERAN